MKKYFPVIQDFHNYVGLFISPFIFVFAVSVLVLNHSHSNKATGKITQKNVKLESIPYDTSDLAIGKAITRRLGITGEIDYVFKGDHNFAIQVGRPGEQTNIKVDTQTDSVFIRQEENGVLQGTVYLHKMPGPHMAQFRKNTVFMKIWSVLADTTVYLILFLTVSGILLWYFLKAERRMGIYAICLGAFVFIALIILIL